MTDADWLMAWCRSLATEVECTNVPARWPTVQIVGMPGYVVTDGDQGAAGIPVTSNARLYQAIVIVANVAYDLRLDGNVDRAYFDALIATMQLAPSDVGDPSPQP
jgi:ribosome-interacting GTPase 1